MAIGGPLMDELELFPAPIDGFAFIIQLRADGTWSVRSQCRIEAGGFGPPSDYDRLSLAEVADVVCSVMWSSAGT